MRELFTSKGKRYVAYVDEAAYDRLDGSAKVKNSSQWRRITLTNKGSDHKAT